MIKSLLLIILLLSFPAAACQDSIEKKINAFYYKNPSYQSSEYIFFIPKSNEAHHFNSLALAFSDEKYIMTMFIQASEMQKTSKAPDEEHYKFSIYLNDELARKVELLFRYTKNIGEKHCGGGVIYKIHELPEIKEKI